MFLNLLLTAEM